jgi:hypothetical protein
MSSPATTLPRITRRLESLWIRRNRLMLVPDAHCSHPSLERAAKCSVIVMDEIFGAVSHGNASLMCGAPATPPLGSDPNSCRRRWPRTRTANSCRKAIVGTTMRSIDAISSTGLRRKLFRLCNGRPCLGTMVIETVERAFEQLTVNSGSAPQRVFTLPIRGRPPRGRDFHLQYAAKPMQCQRTTVSGLTMVTASSAGTATIEPNEQGPVGPAQTQSAWCAPLQDIELMPQYQDFGFQPPPRLEAVAQHADEKEGNCNHATIML